MQHLSLLGINHFYRAQLVFNSLIGIPLISRQVRKTWAKFFCQPKILLGTRISGCTTISMSALDTRHRTLNIGHWTPDTIHRTLDTGQRKYYYSMLEARSLHIYAVSSCSDCVSVVPSIIWVSVVCKCKERTCNC